MGVVRVSTQALADLKARAVAAEAERDALREALEFYANPDNYICWGAEVDGHLVTPVVADHGKRAYDALEINRRPASAEDAPLTAHSDRTTPTGAQPKRPDRAEPSRAAIDEAFARFMKTGLRKTRSIILACFEGGWRARSDEAIGPLRALLDALERGRCLFWTGNVLVELDRDFDPAEEGVGSVTMVLDADDFAALAASVSKEETRDAG